MGSTGLTHVQFSLHPQTSYFRRPILSSHRLGFRIIISLMFRFQNYVTAPAFPMYLQYVYPKRVLYFNIRKYYKSEQIFSLYHQVFGQMAW
jgi:hypothetical protein